VTLKTSSSRSGEEAISLLVEKTLSDLENDSNGQTDRLFPSSPNISSFKLWIRSARPSYIRSALYSFSIALIPSFVSARWRKDRSRQDKLFPTAYLDGMRGLAALFVFFCHYTYTCFVITLGYGYGGPGENRNILQLPIIRLLYSGPPMVCVFFVISGYALSLKPLKQMRSKAWEGLYTTISSSVFRRGLRLFIPTLSSCFMVFVMLRLGFYEPTRSMTEDKSLHRNIHEPHPHRAETFDIQLHDWIHQMNNFICVFDWTQFAGSTGYDVHLWTIPVEYRASLMLFLALIGLSRLQSWIRLSLLIAIMTFVFKKDRWELLLFYSGMFIAELDLIIQSFKPSEQSSFSKVPSSRRTASTIIWITLAIVSLYLMSQPDDHSAETPGWIWLSSIIPEWFSEKYRYWQTLGSITFVLAVNRLPLLQKPFNTPFVQYFGKISYALYLMHGPVMHVVGYLIQKLAWRITGHESQSSYIFGFLLGAVFNIPLVIWASDVFWRFIDAPSVRFSRWLETKLIVDDISSRPKELPR
jgi:peptidoglycan/LPS O-acetylase OafA/YrhL